MKNKQQPLIHFLFGSDEREKERYITRITSQYPDINTGFGIFKFDLKTDALTDIVSTARTFPFGSSLQIVSVRVSKKLLAADKKILEAYCKNPPEFTLIFFNITIDNSGMDSVDMGMNTVVFQSDAGAKDMRAVVVKRLKEEGKSIVRDALQVFLARCGKERSAVCQQLDYLLLYVGVREQVTVDDVCAVVRDVLSYDNFTLANAMVARQFDRVLAIVRDSIVSGMSVQDIMGMVRWQLRRMYEAKCLYMQGERSGAIAKQLRIGPSFIDGFMKNLNTFQLRDVERAIEYLTRLDYEIKTGKIDADIGIETYFIELVMV